jgi:hypothetical protein
VARHGGYWVHDFNEDKLVFLRLVSPESVAASAEGKERVLDIAEVLRGEAEKGVE